MTEHELLQREIKTAAQLVAANIVRELFSNACGKHVAALIQGVPDGRLNATWCREAVFDVIVSEITKSDLR